MTNVEWIVIRQSSFNMQQSNQREISYLVICDANLIVYIILKREFIASLSG